MRVIIIGAGPAGLTAAYELCKSGLRPTVLEANPDHVGGIARTAQYKGYHFDIGGHRFFSKSREIEDLWTELCPDDMLRRSRKSRIYYRRPEARYLASYLARYRGRGCYYYRRNPTTLQTELNRCGKVPSLLRRPLRSNDPCLWVEPTAARLGWYDPFAKWGPPR